MSTFSCSAKQLNVFIQFLKTSSDFVQNTFLKQPFSAMSNDLYF